MNFDQTRTVDDEFLRQQQHGNIHEFHKNFQHSSRFLNICRYKMKCSIIEMRLSD